MRVSTSVGRISLNIRISLFIANSFQESLPDRSTVVSITLHNDKTILSRQRGDKTAWLVNLRIGNLSQAKRQLVKIDGFILISFLTKCANG